MRRFLSAIAFLVMLVAVMGAAACGQRFEREAGDAPTAGNLAADALAALEAAGSAHFVADLKSGTETAGMPLEFSVHAEGDVSRTALDAEATVGFGGASFQGHVLVGEHDLFIQFMNQWYGGDQGWADGLRQAQAEHEGQVWNELATPEGLRRNFEGFLDGEVSVGPVIDGAATWEFDGKLNPEGILDFARRFDAHPTDRDEDMLAKVAEASLFRLVVGQDDHLPRRLELSVKLSADDLEEMESSDSPTFGGAANFEATLELSDFGKSVEIEPPADFKPLDTLFENVFAGL